MRRIERIDWGILFTLFWLLFLVGTIVTSLEWPEPAKRFPWTLGILGICLISVQLVWDVVRMINPKVAEDTATMVDVPVDRSVPKRDVIIRGGIVAAWLFGFMLSISLIGFMLTVPLFVFAFVTVYVRDRWWMGVILAGAMWLVAYLVFDQILTLPWPQSRFF